MENLRKIKRGGQSFAKATTRKIKTAATQLSPRVKTGRTAARKENEELAQRIQALPEEVQRRIMQMALEANFEENQAKNQAGLIDLAYPRMRALAGQMESRNAPSPLAFRQAVRSFVELTKNFTLEKPVPLIQADLDELDDAIGNENHELSRIKLLDIFRKMYFAKNDLAEPSRLQEHPLKLAGTPEYVLIAHERAAEERKQV